MDATRRILMRCFEAVHTERWGRRGTWLALVFHHITDGDTFSADDPRVRGLGIDMSIDTFADVIRFVQRKYEVVSLDEAASGRLVNRSGRRPVLFCFDDAYASVARLAAPLLAAHSVPWTFFVNPGLIGSVEPALDNRLAFVANTVGRAGLSTAFEMPVASVAEAISVHLPRLDPAARQRLAQRLDDAAGLDRGALRKMSDLYLTAGELRQLHESGVEIGNHTRDHVHCRSLDKAAVAEQIVGSAEELRAMLGAPVRAFAYPYGSTLDATPAIRESLRSSGHRHSFVVQGRLNTADTPHDHLYRVSLPPSTRNEADMTSAMELLPLLRSLKARIKAPWPGRTKGVER